MKLYYLSTTSFADCDVNLLHHLSPKYDITFGVIIPNKNANYSDKELENYSISNNIIFKPFYIKYRFRNIKTIFTYFSIINSIIKTRPDIVYINNFDQLYLNILLVLFLSKYNTIIAIHDVVNHSGTPANFMSTIAKKLLINSFSKFLTFSESQSLLLKRKWPYKDVTTIPLMLKDFGPLDRNLSTDKINLLFFGNVKKYKGLDILLQSIKRLSKKYNNFTLTIAGRCNDWNVTYAPLIYDLKNISPHIRFIGNDEIPSFFSNAHYLILPYRDATQSGPLMIAYNYNVPVIASNIDGFREFIVDSETGYLFNINDEQDLDRVLEEAINNSSTCYNALLSNLNAYVSETLSVNSIVKKYDKLFSDSSLVYENSKS